jgi:hypothetical protein
MPVPEASRVPPAERSRTPDRVGERRAKALHACHIGLAVGVPEGFA